MASRSLGTLVLDLVARTGGYVEGLGKAEREAQKRAKAIEKAFDGAATAIGVGIGAAIAGAIGGAAALDNLIKQAGDFQDIAEKIGGSAEGIASFALAAGTTGTAMETVASASVKLTKSLVGVDDESKAAGAALGALGLNVKEFKDLAPEDQLETVAKALGQFEDGAEKTAVAVALFGKAGAELLPFLKELEAQGGRQVILTEEQIKLADEYADAQARARTELNLYAQAAAVQAVPALTSLTGALTDVIKELIGVDAGGKVLGTSTAIKDFAEFAVKSLAFVIDTGDLVVRIFRAVGQSIYAAGAAAANVATGDFSAAKSYLVSASKEIDRIFNEKTFGSRLQARMDQAISDANNFDSEARRRAGRGPSRRINYNGPADRDPKAKAAAKERETEAEKYLESLQKQLQKTQDLSVEETLLAEIQSGRLKISGKVTEQQLLDAARAVDMAKAADKAQKERQETGRAQALAEGDAVNKANEARQKSIDQILDRTPIRMLEEQRKMVEMLTEEYTKGRISEQLYLEGVTEYLDLSADKLKKSKTLAEELGQSFTEAFEDMAVNGAKFSDVLKTLEKDIIRLIMQKFVTNPLGELFGGGTGGGGGGWMEGFGKFFSSIFSADGGGFTGTGARSGGLDGRGGFVAMLHPNETVVDHTRGQGMPSVVINQSFAPGTDRKTMNQAAAAAGQRVQMAIARGT